MSAVKRSLLLAFIVSAVVLMVGSKGDGERVLFSVIVPKGTPGYAADKMAEPRYVDRSSFENVEVNCRPPNIEMSASYRHHDEVFTKNIVIRPFSGSLRAENLRDWHGVLPAIWKSEIRRCSARG